MSKLRSFHLSWVWIQSEGVYLTKKSSPETIEAPMVFVTLTQNNRKFLGEPGNLVPKFPNLLPKCLVGRSKIVDPELNRYERHFGHRYHMISHSFTKQPRFLYVPFFHRRVHFLMLGLVAKKNNQSQKNPGSQFKKTHLISNGFQALLQAPMVAL